MNIPRITRILGIDPGSRLTGYGCVDLVGNQIRWVTHGTLKLASTSGRQEIPLEERLLLIHEGMTAVIREFKPEVMSIERVFFAKNAVSALKLGQARGAAILSGRIHSLSVFEYSPTEVKAAVVGHGRADKNQVAHMIQALLGKQSFETSDASDGLALAVCHALWLSSQLHRGASTRAAAGASTGSLDSPAPRRGKRLSLAESVGITAEMVESGKRHLPLNAKK